MSLLRLTTMSAAIASAVAATSALAGTPTFTEIGPGTVTDLSYDGTTVVGTDGSGQAYIWHKGDAAVTLIGGTNVTGVSACGQICCGEMPDGSGVNNAAVWNAVSGWTTLPPLAGSTGCPDLSNGYEISGNGLISVGLGWDDCSGFAFVNDGYDNQIYALPQVGPNSARANNISNDGTAVGGWDEDATGPRLAAIWYNGNPDVLILTGMHGNVEGLGEVWALNNDGSYATGQAHTDIITGGGFRWRQSDGQIDQIAPLPGTDPAFFTTAGLGITEDGQTVVGTNISGFGPFADRRAIIWDEVNGTRELQTVLEDMGVVFPDGYVLISAEGISPDGKTIAGYGGMPPFATSAWIIEFPDGGCPADLNGDGMIGYDDLLVILSTWGPCP